MPTTLGAVVFDFDGLLADTEEIHSRTWRAALAERGIDVTVGEYADHWIRRGRGVADLIAARNLPYTVDELLVRKKALYFAEIEDHLRPMPGALELLDALAGRTRLALVTSGRRVMVDAALARVGMAGRFEATVTFEMVAQPKPHPEPFHLVARMLDLPPGRCVALDDAEKGIVAAADAGMPAVAVPNEHTLDHDFSRAALVVPSLEHLTHDVLARLARA